MLYPESANPVPRAAETGLDARAARVVRAALTPAEAAASMDFSLPLRMRNFDELQARVARGDIIPRAEMAEKYLPLPADYEKVVAWAVAKGFTLTYADASHLSVFLRGPVSRVAEVFQTDFGRVASDGGEFTSALTAPSLPMALAPALLGVNGLQPHLRARKAAPLRMQPLSLSSPNSPPYMPVELRRAYNATTTGLTGSGETIAIVIDTYLLPSDLTRYWADSGVPQSLGNITRIPVASGTSADTAETTIDVELTSSMAPGAAIRIYTVGDLMLSTLNLAYNQVFNDLPSQPGLHQLNLSFGTGENRVPADLRVSDSQIFAALAAAGVSIIASTGDGGSNPSPPPSGDYSTSATLQPILPAADPSITGVGGTTLNLNLSSGTISSETGWSLTSRPIASGGGISNLFARPSWQTVPGVPGNQRLVPDVSIVGDPSTGCDIFLNGSYQAYGGTSISAPIWSGFTALINQARIAAGQPPLGLLGPHIYPLIGTTSFHDIASGNNGAYNAGPGYDMVTGLGSPDVAALALALGATSFAPTITAQPSSQTVAAGRTVTFRFTAIGNPEPTYRWRRQPAGSATWNDLSDAPPYSGSTTTSLEVSSVTEAMSGDQFQCILANSVPTMAPVTTLPVALIVASPLTIATLAGSGGVAGSTDGSGSAARFDHPSDLAVDSADNLYVTDTNNHTIRRITPAGVVSTFAGLAGASGTTDGAAGAARFNHPTGIAIDASGNLFVADTDNNIIRRITPGAAVTTLAGTFSSPSDVAVDSAGNVIIADTGSHTIRRIAAGGGITTVAGLAGSLGNSDGTGPAARFSAPEGVAVDGTGNIYVADTGNHTIRKITPAGAVSTFAGQAGMSGTSDGIGAGARFQFPSDLALDGSGNLYVADTDNHTIRKVSPAGATGTVAGQPGVNGSADGVGTSARFYFPTGIAVDTAGDVYVADTNNDTIRESIVAIGPIITTQPRSQSVTVGTTAQFSVTATGTPALTYQWRLNNGAIAGATSSTFTLSNAQFTDAGSYTVVVTNAAGSVTSLPATLTVNPTTTIPPSGGGGGGGGAPSVWFLAALVVLAATRRLGVRRSPPA